MPINKLFNPPHIETGKGEDAPYVYDDDIILAVNVMMATGRPLLISGPPGTGKTKLAQSVARVLKRRYLEQVITSRTQARDLLWSFDTLRRLSDATRAGLRSTDSPLESGEDLTRYITPRVLWLAFDPASATKMGPRPNSNSKAPSSVATDVSDLRPAIVLLDEIDKADPDVPNDLLEPIDKPQFRVEDLEDRRLIKLPTDSPPPLIMISTNGERELPAAFRRRCVILDLKRPQPNRLMEIAKAHFDARFKNIKQKDGLYRAVAQLVQAPDAATEADPTWPGTAEYLDTVLTALRLNERPGSPNWPDIERATLWKGRKLSTPSAASAATNAINTMPANNPIGVA